jgi:hypothetical protein
MGGDGHKQLLACLRARLNGVPCRAELGGSLFLAIWKDAADGMLLPSF